MQRYSQNKCIEVVREGQAITPWAFHEAIFTLILLTDRSILPFRRIYPFAFYKCRWGAIGQMPRIVGNLVVCVLVGRTSGRGVNHFRNLMCTP